MTKVKKQNESGVCEIASLRIVSKYRKNKTKSMAIVTNKMSANWKKDGLIYVLNIKSKFHVEKRKK